MGPGSEGGSGDGYGEGAEVRREVRREAFDWLRGVSGGARRASRLGIRYLLNNKQQQI